MSTEDESLEEQYLREYQEWIEGVRIGRPEPPKSKENTGNCDCNIEILLQSGCKCGGQ